MCLIIKSGKLTLRVGVHFTVFPSSGICNTMDKNSLCNKKRNFCVVFELKLTLLIDTGKPLNSVLNTSNQVHNFTKLFSYFSMYLYWERVSVCVCVCVCVRACARVCVLHTDIANC